MTSLSDPKLRLSGLSPFATGGNRLCFRHPDDNTRCIKVNKQGKAADLKRNAPFYKRLRPEKSFDDNWREYREYQRSINTNSNPQLWEHLPRCYGWVATDIGPGLVSDFYADDYGQPAKTLEAYLHAKGIDDAIRQALSEFAQYLRSTLLLTKNLLPHNLLVVGSPADQRLVLIDGLGLHSILPLARYSKHFARMNVERRLQRFENRIYWEVSEKTLGWRETERKLGKGKAGSTLF